MQQLEDEDELAYSSEDATRLDTPAEGAVDGRPAWMRTLHNSATTWLQLLPQNLQVCPLQITMLLRSVGCHYTFITQMVVTY